MELEWEYNEKLKGLTCGSYETKPFATIQGGTPNREFMASVYPIEQDVIHVEFFWTFQEAQLWCEAMIAQLEAERIGGTMKISSSGF